MKTINEILSLEITNTQKKCPIGEKVGGENLKDKKIPVISCEGACIRGEIARLAANMVAKEDPYRRSCHGEMFTAPQSAMAHWMREAEKVIVIDGCFLHCHGRILKNIIPAGNVAQFNALSVYNKYADVFEIDEVSEEDRKKAARQVADKVIADMTQGTAAEETMAGCGCTGCS